MSDGEVKRGQFRCEMCHEVFDLGWTEEEARAEAEGKGLDINDCVLVCDDCYRLNLPVSAIVKTCSALRGEEKP